MRLPTLALSCVTALTASSVAQSWQQSLAERWPGDAIRKATEREFARFLDDAVDPTEKTAAMEAFLAAQWQAHGLPAVHAHKVFLSPASRQFAPTTVPVDARVAEGPEPNGDPSTPGGGTPTVIGCGDQGEGNVFPYGDRDWWAISLPSAQGLVAFTGPGLGATIDDTILELYDQNGVLLTANDDYGPRGRFSQLSYDTPAAGTYYLAVRGYADVRVGTYSLDVLCGVASGVGTTAESAEPNGTPATATPLQCGATGTGNLGATGDSDWWEMVLGAQTAIVAETAPGSTGITILDTTLTLRSATGALLLFDDDGGNGLYSRIAATLPAGTYYLDVQDYGNNNTGTYEIRWTCGAASGTSSFVTAAGGCAGSAGVPTLGARQGELPLLGSTFAFEVSNVPTGAASLAFIGFSTSMTTGGAPLPILLGPIGAPGCAIEVDPLAFLPLSSPAGGVAAGYLSVPGSPALANLTMYVQAVVVDRPANQLGLTLSNRGTAVLGDGL